MAEKKIVFKNKQFSFYGLFDMKGLFRTISKWIADNGYFMRENRNFEEVHEADKKIVIELTPYKKLTDYHQLVIRIFITCESLKEVDVELKGVKHKLLKGNVFIILDGTLITDYENRWEGEAKYFFFRTLIDKLIFKSHTRGYEGELVRNAGELEEEIKSYLNMFRYAN